MTIYLFSIVTIFILGRKFFFCNCQIQDLKTQRMVMGIGKGTNYSIFAQQCLLVYSLILGRSGFGKMAICLDVVLLHLGSFDQKSV